MQLAVIHSTGNHAEGWNFDRHHNHTPDTSYKRTDLITYYRSIGLSEHVLCVCVCVGSYCRAELSQSSETRKMLKSFDSYNRIKM